MKKPLKIFIFVIVILILLLILFMFYNRIDVDRKIQTQIYDKIPVGISKTEVLNRFGKPYYSSDSVKLYNLPDSIEALVYYTSECDSLPRLPYTVAVIVKIDRKNDKVVSIALVDQ